MGTLQPMRLLVLADDAPPADPVELAVRNAVDAVVTLGDLRPEWLVSLPAAGVPLLGVHGNHDGVGDLARVGIEDIHRRRVEVGGWSFAGWEGCVRYGRGGPHQYTQEQADALVPALPAAEVLVCHCPPLGVDDDPDDPAHVGVRALRDWVERHEPRLLLHGHTTPDPRTRRRHVGATEVVWVRGARVVELDRAPLVSA